MSNQSPSPEPMNSSEDTGNDDDTLYIIVAAAAVGFVVALVALAVLACRRRSVLSSSSPAVTTAVNSVSAVPEEGAVVSNKGKSTSGIGVSSEIFLGDKEDVSTLGDPVLQQSGMVVNGGTDQDEQTASVENDYDYKKQYMKSQGVGSLDSFERISSDTSISVQYSSVGAGLGGGAGDDGDGDGLKIRFEVNVPPGKLGMVIDTPNGSVPCVHAIKSDSILVSHVKVGDRLVTVDGDDVTAMTAMQVSQLISLKSDQKRLLIFVRHPQQPPAQQPEAQEEQTPPQRHEEDEEQRQASGEDPPPDEVDVEMQRLDSDDT